MSTIPDFDRYVYLQTDSAWQSLNPQFGALGCGVCCAASIASYKENAAITPSVLRQRGVFTSTDMTTIWNNASDLFNFSGYQYLDNDVGGVAEIRKQVDTYRDPVVVRVWGNSSGSIAHFVVAYGYTGSGTTRWDIKVMDPLRGLCTLGDTMTSFPIYKYIYTIY